MVKSRKRLISLIVAVVMVATLLIPMVGPASANVTYSMTNVKKIYNTGQYINTYQKIGQLEFTFDPASWNLASGAYSATNTNFIYLMLPTSPAGFAFAASTGVAIPPGVGAASQPYNISPAFDTTFQTGAILSNVSNTVYSGGNTPVNTITAGSITGGQGIVTIVGLHPVTVGTSGGYQVLAIYVTNIVKSATDPTGVTVSLQLPWLAAPSGTNGPVTANVSIGGSSSVFSGGASTVTIATVGAGTYSLAAESTPSISSSSTTQPLGIIDIKENSQGVLYAAGSTTPVLSLTLPPGFEWSTPTGWAGTYPAGYTSSTTGGDFADLSTADSLNSNGSANYESFDTLTSPYATDASGNPYGWETSNNASELDLYNASYASTGGQWIQFTGQIIVSDESQAQTGNITLTVTGSATPTVSTLVVGTYGGTTLGATATVATAPTIVSGKAAVTTGEIQLQESSPGSLAWGRTITLTLPNDVAWAQAPTLDNNLSTNTGNIGNALNSSAWTTEGTSGTIIQCNLTAPAGITTAGPTAGESLPGNFFLQNAEVTTGVDFSGPITVTIGGSEGLTSTVAVANVSAGVTATASSTPNVQIGTSSQTLGDLTITEATARALDTNVVESGLQTNGFAYHVTATGGTAEIDIVAPAGVTFATTPTVTVTTGNIQLGTATTSAGATIGSTTYAGNQGVIQIPIKGISTTASTIKIAAPVVDIDNTLAAGQITFKVQGTAVNETMLGSLSTTGTPSYTSLFPNDTTAVTVNVATVGTGGTTTPAGSGTAVFTIGKTSYTLNGSPVTMDVAPFIKDSRTFLPLRYVANALGVADANITYDPATQKVTIIKGNSVVQLIIGSTTMLLNGASITMDTAPEITSGRTCLPVAWIAQALGASTAWDATAQTVTVTF